MPKFDYRKAEADLFDVGAHHPDEIYDYKSEKSFRGYMKEHGLNPDKYYKPDGKNNNSRSGSSSGSGTDGCYLTSACVFSRGLSDDCDELQTLRSFRDGYFRNQPEGAQEIQEYYQIAPEIVAAINQLPNATKVWNRVYEEMIAPCVQLIHEGRNDETHQLYREYTLKLSSLV